MAYLLHPNSVHLPPYAWLPDVFTPEECGRLIACADAQGMHPGEISCNIVNTGKRANSVAWLEWSLGMDWAYARLGQACVTLRQWYPFHLSGFIEPLQVARYDGDGTQKGHYSEHQDMGHGLSASRKLSLVVQLTDPDAYQGGALHLHGIDGEDKAVPFRNTGTLIAFPSWASHCVMPITQGTRCSLVAWVHGPAFV